MIRIYHHGGYDPIKSEYISILQIRTMFNFEIKNEGEISMLFLSGGITSFFQAANFIQQLPYGRNASKNDLTSIFRDQCGTCSTKHAVLKTLADENMITGLNLMTGIYKMNAVNTVPVSTVLSRYNLDYIPEAHCYLKYGDTVLDFTKNSNKPFDFLPDLLEEHEISPGQITDYKVNYHKQFLIKWLLDNPHIPYNAEELWTIREMCIRALSD